MAKIDYEYVIPEQIIHVKGLACDNPDCRKVVIDSDTQRQWLPGAFQSGVNSDNEVGTWCSNKCFKKMNPHAER